MEVASLYDLPNEILTHVAKCLVPSQLSADDNTIEPRRDLRSLSLVSKRLHNITTSVLYSHVHVSSVRQLELLVRELLSRPKLFLPIRKLSLSTTLCHCTQYPVGWNDTYSDETTCNNLARLILHSKSLRELLLNLKACKECWQDHVDWEDFEHCGDLNVGYKPFYRLITQEVPFSGGPHFQLLPNLETVYIASSRSLSTLECFPALFSIPSLRKVICLQDPGTGWERKRSHSHGHFEDDYTHIKTFELQKTGLTVRGISRFCEVFPALQNLSITNNINWTLHTYANGEDHISEEVKDLSSSLAKMTGLTQLS